MKTSYSTIAHRTFILHQAGRDPIELIANSIQEAKAKLRAMAREEKIRCRLRFGKHCGHLHRANSFQYLITIGRDARSSLWTSLSLEVQP